MKHGRLYSPDKERWECVWHELIKQHMNISNLTRALRIDQSIVSRIVNDVRYSKKTEAKIAIFFGKEPRELFPPHNKLEIEAMWEATAQWNTQ